MKRVIRNTILLAMALLAGCIENDIPYPERELDILAVEGEGFTVAAIDIVARNVAIKLDETTDIRNVKITSIVATEGAELSSGEGTYDMRTPLYITLSQYQEYLWTITAEQEIPRRFRVAGQIGDAEFDIRNRIATANVSEATAVEELEVYELKLEAEGITTYDPTVEELSGEDFSSVRFVNATCHGRTERWTLRVNRVAQRVAITAADAWTRVIWLYGAGVEGSEMGFAYRREGDAEWNRISSTDGSVAVSGGSFSARIVVEPLTKYEIKAFCGEDESEVIVRTTEKERQLPNCGLEQWSQPKAPWLPFASDGEGNPVEPFWGTGNNGATVLGEKYNLTTPVTDLPPGVGGTYAAQLESRYVVMKLAAGNLFLGEFFGIRSLSHGIVNFGRPFTLRPTALRLWVKYNCGQITNENDIGGVPAGETLAVGDYDTGSIFIALGTWTKEEYGYGRDREELFGTDDCPVSIDTRDVKTFFNPNGKDVIGYGSVLFNESLPEWRQITIPIDYRGVTDRQPTHIILACSASRWGDYFTGSRDSKMWVDEIELLYD